MDFHVVLWKYFSLLSDRVKSISWKRHNYSPSSCQILTRVEVLTACLFDILILRSMVNSRILNLKLFQFRVLTGLLHSSAISSRWVFASADHRWPCPGWLRWLSSASRILSSNKLVKVCPFHGKPGMSESHWPRAAHMTLSLGVGAGCLHRMKGCCKSTWGMVWKQGRGIRVMNAVNSLQCVFRRNIECTQLQSKD